MRNCFLRKIGWISDNLVLDDDIDRQLIISHGVIGAGLACKICSSSWMALVVGAVLTYAFGLPVWFPVLAFFSPQYLVERLVK